MQNVKYDSNLPTISPEGQQVPKATLDARKYNGALRLEVFTHYCHSEPHCQCDGCRTTYIEFLQLDHLNGDGAAHRKENNLGTGGPRLWRWVREHGYPEGFQVLCRNCNGAKFTRAACRLSGQPH